MNDPYIFLIFNGNTFEHLRLRYPLQLYNLLRDMLIVRNHQPSWLLCPFSDMLQTMRILSCREVASQLLIRSVVPLAMFEEVRPRAMSGFI